jgi:transposase
MRKFSSEFKESAIRLVLDTPGMKIKQASKELGVGISTLDKWLKAARSQEQGSDLTNNEREELRRLRTENQKLRLERELLKKAAVFFANNGSS